MPTLEAVDPGPSGSSAGPPPGSPSDDQVVSDNAIDDAPGPAISEARPNTTKKGQYFGMPKNRAAPVYLRPDDYEQKYPPDDIEEALGPNARVWRVYLDEAQAFDSNMIEGWKDTIDVLLVFAGLFSAVVTTFVVQTSQNLQPDYSEISALLLSELVGLQRAMAEGRLPASGPASSQNATSFVAQKSDQWINGLWFTSLALSLATALMSVLVKQWLQYYMMPVSGTSQEQVHVRQFRYTGMKLWHVGGIIGCLPILMHLALMLFCIGLVILVIQLNKGIAIAVAIVVGMAYIGYFATNVWAIIDVQCPYKTPLSDFTRLFLKTIRSKMHKTLLKLQKICLYIYRDRHVTHNNVSEVSLEQEYTPKEKDSSIEKNVIQSMTETLDMDALVWLSTISSNISTIKIIYYLLAALDLDKHDAITLISCPMIEHCYFDTLSKFTKNDNTTSHDIYSTFWADVMICATYFNQTVSTKITDFCYFDIYDKNRTEYPICDKILRLVVKPLAGYYSERADQLRTYANIFEDMLQLSATEDWLWNRVLHVTTHLILANNMTASELVQIGLLYLKLGCYSDEKYQRSNLRPNIVMEKLYFLLKHNFSIITSTTILNKKVDSYTVSSEHQWHQMTSKIFLLYFDNIDRWIDNISETDIDLLINYWLDHWSDRIGHFDMYLEQSIRLLNCNKIYDKLNQSRIKRILILTAFSFSNPTERIKTIFNQLNECFLFNVFIKKQEEHCNDAGYYMICLEIINHTKKFSFWCSYNIIDIMSHLPIDKELWTSASKFVSYYLEDKVSWKLSAQFLGWYCGLFLKHLNESRTINDGPLNSEFLELMKQSLDQPVWTGFLASVIKKYNQAAHKFRTDAAIAFLGSSSCESTYYFLHLVYISQMKRRLNVNSTNNKFKLYAYIGGRDIKLLRHLDSAQHAPYSIVFELEHFESEERKTPSPILKPQPANFASKAVQKVFRFGRAPNQIRDTELVSV